MIDGPGVTEICCIHDAYCYIALCHMLVIPIHPRHARAHMAETVYLLHADCPPGQPNSHPDSAQGHCGRALLARPLYAQRCRGVFACDANAERAPITDISYNAIHSQTLSSATAGHECLCACTSLPVAERVPGPYFCRRFLSSPPTRPLLLVFFQVFLTNTSPFCVACLVHARDRQQRQLTATSHSASHSSTQPATDAQLIRASLYQQTAHTIAHIVIVFQLSLSTTIVSPI